METKEIKTNQVKSNSKELQGLCINCDNKKDCNIRDTSKKVIHCEEYM